MVSPDAPVKAAIFDIGATLVTGPPVAPNKVIAALLESVSAADVARVIMTRPFESADGVCAALETEFGRIDGPARMGIADLWESQAFAAAELDGATETVLGLKREGLKIGLLSDIWSPYYASVEKALPRVIEAADAVVLSCRTGCRKPEPGNFLTALDELGVAPEQAVMVGDTYDHDIRPALELGMRTVWVLARPDREVRSIIKILNWHWRPPTWTVWEIGEVGSLGLDSHPTPPQNGGDSILNAGR